MKIEFFKEFRAFTRFAKNEMSDFDYWFATTSMCRVEGELSSPRREKFKYEFDRPVKANF